MLGGIVSILFTLLPLLAVRFVPPLTVLRADFSTTNVFSKSRLTATILLILFPILAAAYQTKSFISGGLFSVGLALALGCLSLVAMALLFLVKKYYHR